MTQHIETYRRMKMGWVRMVALLLMLASTPLVFAQKKGFGYNEDRPLVVVFDWDYAPYEYIDEEEHIRGYNVEVMDSILSRLQVPHRFVAMEWTMACDMFERGEAQLIHTIEQNPFGEKTPQTRKYVTFDPTAIGRREDARPINDLSELKEGDTLLLERGDYTDVAVQAMGEVPFAVKYCNPREALCFIHQGKYQYFVWSEVAMKTKLKEIDIDDIVVEPLDIRVDKVYAFGHDAKLIRAIDEEYAHMELTGDLQSIYNRWFRPERLIYSPHSGYYFLISALSLLILLAMIYTILAHQRMKKARRRNKEIATVMESALKMGEYVVTRYDLKTMITHTLYGEFSGPEGMPVQELLSHITPEQVKEYQDLIERVMKGESQIENVDKRWNWGTEENPNYRDYAGMGIAEYDEEGKPTHIVYAYQDVTEVKEKEREARQSIKRFKEVFDSNLIGMSIYDKNGERLDTNQAMLDILCETEEQKKFFNETNMFMPYFNGDVDLMGQDIVYSCQHILMEEIGLDKYLETKKTTVRDQQGNIVYYLVTAIDVTGERKVHMDLRCRKRELQKALDDITRRDEQMSIILSNSRIFTWYYSFKDEKIYFTRTQSTPERVEPKEYMIASLVKEDQEKVYNQYKDLFYQLKPIDGIAHFQFTPFDDHPCWYAVSAMPVFDKDGKPMGYFGVDRNIDVYMHAQEKLKQETARAQSSGLLKSTFLANMTHEIRTPLNAVVGFSELLQMESNEEERKEYMRIIHDNCDMLLRLVSDFLEASTLQDSVAINAQTQDISQAFNDICQVLQLRLENTGLQFVKDNPYTSLTATFDKDRLQQVLTNFVTNAVKYTHQGYIKLGYRLEGEELYFYCEDSGIGVPADKCDTIFERFVKLDEFVQGSGLGLNISKMLVEKCGGVIGVKSDGEGHGSTFWFKLPRHLTV